ncbi:hypothetical protein HAX54_049702 [Datura stramonium]|uniref:Uncharacterized protein n=1 Tax=Datura stramonium TaxID=4076 RepID=A0ABS8WPH1_DATST|nr:hypothetical protein [Datura stramonium]
MGQTVGPNVKRDEESPKDPNSQFKAPKGYVHYNTTHSLERAAIGRNHFAFVKHAKKIGATKELLTLLIGINLVHYYFNIETFGQHPSMIYVIRYKLESPDTNSKEDSSLLSLVQNRA